MHVNEDFVSFETALALNEIGFDWYSEYCYADTGDYDTVWYSKGKTYLLDTGLFPDMDSDSEPQECEIIIKRKKNG